MPLLVQEVFNTFLTWLQLKNDNKIRKVGGARKDDIRVVGKSSLATFVTLIPAVE